VSNPPQRNVASVAYGESIASIRQMIKRPVRSVIWAFEEGAASMQLRHFAIDGLKPIVNSNCIEASTLYTTGTNTYVTNSSWIGYYARMFIGMKGGMRYRFEPWITVNSSGNIDTTDVVQSRNIGLLAPGSIQYNNTGNAYSFYEYASDMAAYGTGTSGLVSLMEGGNAVVPAAFLDVPGNSVVPSLATTSGPNLIPWTEVEVPDYSAGLYRPTNYHVTTQGVNNPWDQMCAGPWLIDNVYSLGAASALRGSAVWQSTADDFSLFHFVMAPLCFN